LSAATGASFAVACANGTAALHLAATSLDLKSDDWVIVPAVTFLATANAARLVGAEVWFADVDPDTGLLTRDTLRQALAQGSRSGKRMRAIFPVHLNGQVAEPGELWTMSQEAGLALVEDACHAIGTSYMTPQGEARVGSGRHSTMAAFSFHAVKTIAMGEGGAVTTEDAGLADRVRRLRNHGMTRDANAFTETEQAFSANLGANPWYYEMHEPGFNYRASDIQCALGLSQLAKLDRFVAARRRIAALYDERLAPLAPAIRPVTRVQGCDPAWHLYVVLIDFAELGSSRADVMRRLVAAGIQTQVHYLPVNRQPYYRTRYGRFELPGADRYYARCLSLPLFPSIIENDVDRVVDALVSAVQAR
jgi:dTDP-4-amino-4,6-dideoxygalactose transaminase